jgi:hypothetical protein
MGIGRPVSGNVMIFGIDVRTKFAKAYCSPETKSPGWEAAAVEARVEAGFEAWVEE